MFKNTYLNKYGHVIITWFKRLRLRRFYIEANNDGKTYTATFLDSIFFKAILSLLLFFFLLYKSKDILFTSVLLFQLIILYILIDIKVKAIKLRKIKEKINSDIVKNKVYRDLQNKTPSEFINFFNEVFEKNIVEEVKQVHEKNIDIQGVIDGKGVGIKCYQYTEDYCVEVKDVREFFLSLKRLSLEEGIIITTSSLSEDVKDFIPKLKKHIIIHLIDMDKLMSLLRKAEMYPSQKEIEKIIFSQIREKRRKLKEYKNTILTKGKVSKYIILSVVLYLWGRITPYQIYYNVFSVILLLLGIITISKYILSKIKPINLEEEDSLIQ